MPKQKSFTLIELLVVIAVIGLLSSIVLVQLGPVRERARVAKTQSIVTQVGKAVLLYWDTNQTCPAPMHCYDGSCDPWSNNLRTALSPFVNSVESDDPWGLKWRYHCHPGGGTGGECTCFFSSGPNKTIETWPWGDCQFTGDDIGWCQGQPGYWGY